MTSEQELRIKGLLHRIPQSNDCAYHAAPIKSVLIDVEVTRDELLALLPLQVGNLGVTFNLARQEIVFRRVEERGFEMRPCRRT